MNHNIVYRAAPGYTRFANYNYVYLEIFPTDEFWQSLYPLLKLSKTFHFSLQWPAFVRGWLFYPTEKVTWDNCINKESPLLYEYYRKHIVCVLWREEGHTVSVLGPVCSEYSDIRIYSNIYWQIYSLPKIFVDFLEANIFGHSFKTIFF